MGIAVGAVTDGSHGQFAPDPIWSDPGGEGRSDERIRHQRGSRDSAKERRDSMTALGPYQRDRAPEAPRRREDPDVFDVSGNGSAERVAPAGHGATPGRSVHPARRSLLPKSPAETTIKRLSTLRKRCADCDQCL